MTCFSCQIVQFEFTISELKRVQSGDKYKCVSTVEMHHDRPASNALKIKIPVKEYPKVNWTS